MNSVLWTWQIRFPNTRVTTTCAISQKAGLDFIAIWRNVVACSKHFRHLLRLINWWTNLLRFNCDMFRQCFNSGGVGVSWGCITCSCHIKMTLLLSHQHQLNWVVGLSFLNLDCVTRHHPISHPPGFKAEKMNDNCSLTENRLLSLNHQTNIRLIHDVPRTIGQRVSGGRKSRLLLSISVSPCPVLVAINATTSRILTSSSWSSQEEQFVSSDSEPHFIAPNACGSDGPFWLRRAGEVLLRSSSIQQPPPPLIIMILQSPWPWDKHI